MKTVPACQPCTLKPFNVSVDSCSAEDIAMGKLTFQNLLMEAAMSTAERNMSCLCVIRSGATAFIASAPG